jgi:hypothetical protein
VGQVPRWCWFAPETTFAVVDEPGEAGWYAGRICVAGLPDGDVAALAGFVCIHKIIL